MEPFGNKNTQSEQYRALTNTPVNLPIVKEESNRKKIVLITIITAFVVIGAIAATAYLMISQTLSTVKSQPQTEAIVDKTPEPVASQNPTIATKSEEPLPTNSTVPAGWKKYESKQYGISFIYRDTWEVTANNQAQLSGGAYSVKAKIPDGGNYGAFTVTVYIYDDGLSEVTQMYSDSIQTMLSGYPGSKLTSESFTWNGLPAKRMIVTPMTGLNRLFVESNGAVYEVPDVKYDPQAVIEKKVPKADWQTYANSIRIKNKT